MLYVFFLSVLFFGIVFGLLATPKKLHHCFMLFHIYTIVDIVSHRR